MCIVVLIFSSSISQSSCLKAHSSFIWKTTTHNRFVVLFTSEFYRVWNETLLSWLPWNLSLIILLRLAASWPPSLFFSFSESESESCFDGLDFLLSFFPYSYGIRSLRCSRFFPVYRVQLWTCLSDDSSRSRRTTIFLLKAGLLERTAFVHSSVQRRNKTLWVLWKCSDTWKLFYYFFFTEKIKQNYVFSSKTF